MKTLKTITLVLAIQLLIAYCSFTIVNAQITISDDETYTAAPSAMLDVKSLTKGMLVPRLTTIQRDAVSSPATGLLVFDTDEGSFFFYNGTTWINLSSGGDVWTQTGTNVHLTDLTNKVGVGISDPANKFTVKGDVIVGGESIFAVINSFGDTILAVYNGGVRINVQDDPAKASGSKGGFAVGGFSPAKGAITNEYLRVTPDSIRMYVEDDPLVKASGSKGGFAVGGFSPAKGAFTNEYLRVTPDSIRMYIEEGNALKASGSKGGFAVGGFSPAKVGFTNEYLRVTDDSVRVYIEENSVAKATGSKGGFAVGGFSPAKSSTINDYLSVNSDSINVSKSMYLPRMTTTERDNIGFTPSEALIIYNTSDDCMQIFKNGVWSNIWCFQCSPIVIIQPFNATICNGEDTSFAVSATGTNLAYQWQKSTDEGVTWNNISNGGSNPTYSGVASVLLSLYNVPVANHGYLYRCYITASCLPAAYSDVVTLNVGGPSITITSQPQDFQTLANCDANFTIETASFGNFQWQVSTDGGAVWNNITDGGSAPVYSGTTTDSLSMLNVPLSFNNYKYRCVASSDCGTGTNSNAANLTINTVSPVATAATNASYFSFTANWNVYTDATGYFLDVSTTTDFSSFVTGYNNLFVGNVTTYNVSCINSGTYYYRVRAQLACGTGNSNFITVSTLVVATAATNISNVSFSANWNAVTDASSYYLDVSTASDFSSFVTGYNNLNVGFVTTYSVTASMGNYYYRIRAAISCGVSGNSNTVSGAVLGIGLSYAGGKIAYIDGTGQHGLIATPSNYLGTWGCVFTAISGADGTAIGTGNQNTIDIEAGCATAGIAADIAANLVLNGYSDWFLPSKDELNQMYINRVAIGDFLNGDYWSSSEVSANNAWKLDFSSGGQLSLGKSNNRNVRCVRSF